MQKKNYIKWMWNVTSSPFVVFDMESAASHSHYPGTSLMRYHILVTQDHFLNACGALSLEWDCYLGSKKWWSDPDPQGRIRFTFQVYFFSSLTPA